MDRLEALEQEVKTLKAQQYKLLSHVQYLSAAVIYSNMPNMESKVKATLDSMVELDTLSEGTKK